MRKNLAPAHKCRSDKVKMCRKKKTFLFVPLKKFAKWNSIFTILNNPCKFERYRLKKMALGTNGLNKKKPP
jgi:hypothetical protein